MIENKYLKYGRDTDFTGRNLYIEEILFEGKWLLKLLNKGYGDTLSDREIFVMIEKKKGNSKKLKKMSKKTLST